MMSLACACGAFDGQKAVKKAPAAGRHTHTYTHTRGRDAICVFVSKIFFVPFSVSADEYMLVVPFTPKMFKSCRVLKTNVCDS